MEKLMKEFLLWGMMFLSSFFILGYMHESAHVQINKYYGVDSEIHMFSHFPDFATVQTNSSQVCGEECIFLHSMNEIAGYNLEAVFILIGFGIGIFLIKETW